MANNLLFVREYNKGWQTSYYNFSYCEGVRRAKTGEAKYQK